MALMLGQLADEQPAATLLVGLFQAKGFDTRHRENSLTFIPYALQQPSTRPKSVIGSAQHLLESHRRRRDRCKVRGSAM